MAETGLIFGGAEEDAGFAARLAAAGYPRTEPAILQPAEVFIDQSGEDISGRLLLTADPSGADGTPLAEVRDLRRYLLLVEAEMMARGVVKTAPPPQTHADTVVREYLKVKPDEPRDGCEEKTNWPSIETFDTIAGKCWYIFDRNNPGFHHLPRPTYLFAELNYKEWELTEAWYRGMYNWEGEEGKWILQAQFLDKWKRRS